MVFTTFLGHKDSYRPTHRQTPEKRMCPALKAQKVVSYQMAQCAKI